MLDNPKPVTQMVSKADWIEISRRLLDRAAPFFASEERVAINGFINFVAGDVEKVQLRNGSQPKSEIHLLPSR